MLPFQRLPLPTLTDLDFGTKLSLATLPDQPLTWKTIIQLADGDRDPSYYILRLFGIESMQQALKSANTPKWANDCARVYKRYYRALNEILRMHLTHLQQGKSIRLHVQSAIADVPYLGVMRLRPTVILACLQTFVSCYPMPIPQAFAWGLHKIIPIEGDTPNMDMRPFLEGLESKIVQYEKLVDSLFVSSRPGSRPFPVQLTRAQWYDVGLVMTRYTESRGTSKLQLLLEWSNVVPQAKKSVEIFCSIIQVQSLLPSYPPLRTQLKNSSDEGSSSSVTYQRTQEYQLSEIEEYPAWRNDHIFKMLFKSIFFFDGQHLPDSFSSFQQKYKSLFNDPKIRMRGVFFLEAVYDKYVKLRLSTATLQYEQAQAVFQELVGQLDTLLSQDYAELYSFLYASLLITHFSSTNSHLSLDERLTLFDLFYTIQNHAVVSHAILEKTIRSEWPKEREIRFEELMALLNKYSFTPDQKAQIVIKYQHFCLGLRRQFLKRIRTMDFGETLDFISDVERYINGPIGADTIFYLLCFQYFTADVKSCLKHLRDLRQHIHAHIDSKMIPQLRERIRVIQKMMPSPDTSCPADWEDERLRKVAIQLPLDIMDTLMCSTLLCRDRQNHYTRFVTGLIQKVLERSIPVTPLLEWFNVYQQMICEIVPDNRALYVDARWNHRLNTLEVKIIGFHSLKRPCSKMALVSIDITKEVVEQNPELISVVEHLFPMLCEEVLPAQMKIETIENLEKIENLQEMLIGTKELSTPKNGKVFSQLIESLIRSPDVLPNVYEALVKGAESMRKQMRRVMLDLATVSPTSDLIPEKRKQAALGHICDIPNGFMIIPTQEYHFCYGVLASDYIDAITQSFEAMAGTNRGKRELPCVLEVFHEKGLIRQWKVSMTWEKNSLSCCKGRLTHFEHERETVSFVQVTLFLEERPEVCFSAKYASHLPIDEQKRLFLWHFAQLKVEYYADQGHQRP